MLSPRRGGPCNPISSGNGYFRIVVVPTSPFPPSLLKENQEFSSALLFHTQRERGSGGVSEMSGKMDIPRQELLFVSLLFWH